MNKVYVRIERTGVGFMLDDWRYLCPIERGKMGMSLQVEGYVWD